MEYGLYRHDKYNTLGRNTTNCELRGYNCLGFVLGTYTFCEPIQDKEFTRGCEEKIVDWNLRGIKQSCIPFSEYIQSHSEHDLINETIAYVTDVVKESSLICVRKEEFSVSEYESDEYDIAVVVLNMSEEGMHSVLYRDGKLYSKLLTDELIKYESCDLVECLKSDNMFDGSVFVLFRIPREIHDDINFNEFLEYGKSDKVVEIDAEGYLVCDEERLTIRSLAGLIKQHKISIESFDLIGHEKLFWADFYLKYGENMPKGNELNAVLFESLLLCIRFKSEEEYREDLDKPFFLDI